jgi:hypothetical protein
MRTLRVILLALVITLVTGRWNLFGGNADTKKVKKANTMKEEEGPEYDPSGG